MRIIFISLSLFLYNTVLCQVKKLNAETTIENVVIFSSGARVERASVVNIQPGRSEISFPGLSNQLDQQTVQLKADANITLLSVQTTRDFFTGRKIEQQERDFIDRINAGKDKLSIDEKLLAVYRNEEEMLAKNQQIGGQTGVKTVDLKEAVEFQRQRLTEVYNRQLEIQKRLTAQQQELKRNEAQLQEFSKKKDSVNYVVTALIDSKAAQTVNFKLLYNVKDAGWYPAYDVRVTDITEPLTVLMNANVFQRSGETWKNVTLQLSTGNPGDNATPSHLSPWLLAFYDPAVSQRSPGGQGDLSGRVTNEKGEPVAAATIAVKGAGDRTITDNNGYFRLGKIAKNSLVSVTGMGYEAKQVIAGGGYLSISLTTVAADLQDVVVTGYALQGAAPGLSVYREKKKQEASILPVPTSTQYQPTAITYRIDDKYTLESDGKTSTIGIRQLTVPAIYEYYSAPKIDPTAFLTARITNWQEFDLQSGEANLYVEGAYLGKTYIDLAATADTLSLSLGKDNAIKVSRRLLKEYSTKKFIGGNRTDARQYEIIVRNAKRAAVNITFVDQVPVSTTKEISVEDIRAAEAQLDKETGAVTWTMSLPAGQEKKLGISYNVKYPKDRKLVLE